MSKATGGFIKNINLEFVALTVLGSVIVTFWFWLQRNQQEEQYPVLAVAVFWILVLLFLLWLGNSLIYRILRRLYGREGPSNRRFYLQLLLTILYSLACINLSYYAFKTTFTELPPARNQFILLNIYGILFLIPVFSIQFGLLFLKKWKRASVEHEKLKKEQVQTELITLKSHLAPHFLFNNLNILSSLIGRENLQAQEFLDRFAEVYRYVLKNRESELLSLREELEFLESYIFLLRQRFSNSLKVKIQVEPRYQNYLLPPLVLQMVLENALKHNILSERTPLVVIIRAEETPVLVVENSWQPRKVIDEEKTSYGLENIQRRYWLLARQKIEMNRDNEKFSICLPLIIPQ